MDAAILDATLIQTLSNYRLFLQNFPATVEEIKSNLDLLSSEEFHQRLEPMLIYVMPIAKNRFDNWPIELDKLQAQHNDLRRLITDLIIFSGQLSAATAAMSREHRNAPLSDLNFYKPPFDLLSRFTVLQVDSPAKILNQIKAHLQNVLKASSERSFSSSIITDSVSQIIPRIIDFMMASIDIYGRRKGISPDEPVTDAALLAVIENLAKTRNNYQETLMAAGNLHAYFSNNKALLTDAEKLITTVYPSNKISEFNATTKEMIPSLEELEDRLQNF